MPFKKGQVANPTGMTGDKARKIKQLKDLLLPLVPEAVEVVKELLRDPDTASFAVKEIFDRVYGKAPQSVELSGKDGAPLTAVIKDG